MSDLFLNTFEKYATGLQRFLALSNMIPPIGAPWPCRCQIEEPMKIHNVHKMLDDANRDHATALEALRVAEDPTRVRVAWLALLGCHRAYMDTLGYVRRMCRDDSPACDTAAPAADAGPIKLDGCGMPVGGGWPTKPPHPDNPCCGCTPEKVELSIYIIQPELWYVCHVHGANGHEYSAVKDIHSHTEVLRMASNAQPAAECIRACEEMAARMNAATRESPAWKQYNPGIDLSSMSSQPSPRANATPTRQP